ncbi:nuclear architecture related protein [Scheffersomyces coipomensis]|uniref:nuclear architecture related protein n=1 Tax=Scheffersomyces coipomensis TaxID=1788519 RepID=UPI00315DA838
MSAILSQDDLNDFISPSVACIKPIVPASQDESNIGEVEIQIDKNGNPLEISKIDQKVKQLSPAQISLSDCLACSGCITSAEEVLVAQHSYEQLLNSLQDREKVFVVSISHQSRASLAAAYSLSIEQIDKLLINLFIHQLKFSYIIGTSLGRKLSLIEEAKNIINSKKESSENNTGAPLLSSICPGWVLYAEKTHPHVLSYLSTVKSPQQITGNILKTLVSQELGIPKKNIYHLSIMPCFDKKLESARPEKGQEQESYNDVDCVLTPKELVTLLEQHQDEYQLMAPLQEHDTLKNLYRKYAPNDWPLVEYSWSNDSGSTSGGYGWNYLKLYQQHLILKDPVQYQIENFKIKIVNGKNSDIYEMRLNYQDKLIASSIVLNGFRNIQNLVRKLKNPVKSTSGGTTTKRINPLVAKRRARLQKSNSASPVPTSTGLEEATAEEIDVLKADYIEIMACPNGCINGGGQITNPSEISEKDWISEVILKYSEIEMVDLANNLNIVNDLQGWEQQYCESFDIGQERLINTWFKQVEKPTDQATMLLGAKW